MNKAVIPFMGVAIFALMISTNAQAVTGKWCFKWAVAFVDDNMGEDYVKTDEPARYNYVTVHAINPWSDIIYPIFLNSSGCTSDMTIDPSTTYEFKQYTRARRGERDVYVLADHEDWSSTVTPVVVFQFTTPSYMMPSYTKWFTPYAPVNQAFVMPVVANMLSRANTLAWTNGIDLKVSFVTAAPTVCASSHR